LPWLAFLCGLAFGEATVKALLLRRCLVARPNESKNGALRIAAMDDPGSARHLMRSAGDFAAAGAHPLCGAFILPPFFAACAALASTSSTPT
jgi:hypothetical protein